MATSKAFDGVGLTLTGAGVLFIFAGIRGYSVLAVVQNLVTGQPPTTGVTGNAPLTIAEEDMSPKTGMPGPFGAGGNQAIGKNLAKQYGWDSGGNWDSLVKLWERESNWDNHAENPSSGAYGIPQSLPYSKMPKAAWPEKYGGQSDATAQIQWGLDYIKGRYGSPSMAWAHETANGWY